MKPLLPQLLTKYLAYTSNQKFTINTLHNILFQKPYTPLSNILFADSNLIIEVLAEIYWKYQLFK